MDNTFQDDYFQTLYQLHKNRDIKSDFGMDSCSELFQDGFGLYSSVGLKEHIGPHRAKFYRISLGLKGSINIDLSVKNRIFQCPFIAFTLPGQVFSVFNKSEDFFSYYILFSESFIQDAISLKNILEEFPFFYNPSVQTFSLLEKDVLAIKMLFLEINEELKNINSNTRKVIHLYINLILIAAKRSLDKHPYRHVDVSVQFKLLIQFRKLINAHFLEHQPLLFYAEKLCISIKQLNRIVNETTGNTAYDLINDAILAEAKLLLRHSVKSVNEIAYELNFNDPSYFVRFFKKMTQQTPLNYRELSK